MYLHVTHDSAQGGIRRTARLRNVPGERDIEIFFDIDEVVLGPPAVLDGFVFGVIFYAMRMGEVLRVGGTMTRSALLNLNEFQEAWVSWRPHLYHKIEIIPDSIVDCAPGAVRKAIAAFSGGVDSIFTILRHRTKASGAASYPLNDAVLMVHGFDVPLASPDQLESLKERTRPFLNELGLKLLTIRTNLKDLGLQDWEDSSMSQIACCLNNYSDQYGYALVGSTEAYDALVLPWGSNPATDHLLSGDTMRLVHDGAGYSRTEKVAQIATHKTATQVAKVCWEGQETYKNCGVCEKCIRTQLNFRAVGMDHAPCFDGPLDLRLIETVNLRNDTQANELRSIFAYATKAGITAGWLEAVRGRIERYDNARSKPQAKNQPTAERRQTQTSENGEIAEPFRAELPGRTVEYQGIRGAPDLPQLLFLADVYGPFSPHVGDEAMLEANVSLFRRLLPGCRVNVAAGPGWDGARLAVSALPRMEFSPYSEVEREALLQMPHPALESAYPAARAALSCDALIISGGGNLTSIWPNLLCERLAMARLAASKGTPVIILGQTLGPKLEPRDRELLKELLKLSTWTGLRETYSYSLALELGADPKTLSYQVDDATFLAPLSVRTDGFGQSDLPWIVVTLQPVGEAGTGNQVIATLAASLRTIAKKTEAELIFLPHVNFPLASGLVGDGAFGEAIERALNGNPALHIQPVLSAAQTMWLTQQAALVISTRYHPLVFALAGAVPAVGIWTDDYTCRKLQGALIHAGRLGDAMSLDEALAGALTEKALQLWHSRASLRDELRSRITTWRRDEEVRLAKLGDRLRIAMNRKQRGRVREDTNGSEGLSDSLVGGDRTISITEPELSDLKSELSAAEARLASVYSSRCWRITTPLRWCDGIQRLLVRRLRKSFGDF
jgi:polysaccharide pyruvyl transferase WcaK-like protein